MFPVQCEELRINHPTLLVVVTMPYACWLLWRIYYIKDFKWRLHFQFGVAFWRVVWREVYFEGPNRVQRALKTSILNIVCMHLRHMYQTNIKNDYIVNHKLLIPLRWQIWEHLHPYAERQALEKVFEGLQACNQFFLTWHSPTVTCFLALHIEKVPGIFHVSLSTSGWGKKKPGMWA